jgi:hypothetical protein
VISITTAMEHAADASLPAFCYLVNFPGSIGKQRRDGKRRCVMCGTLCLVVRSGGSESLEPITNYCHNGVCKACEVLCWKVSDKDLVIKFCYQCKKIRQWAVFGEEGTFKSCEQCRVASTRRTKTSRKKHTEQPTESVGPIHRHSESINSVGATPKRVKGITHPAHSFGSRGSPQAELGNEVETMSSQKNEVHMGQSISPLPPPPTVPAARTAALSFWQDVGDSTECGAVMLVCSKGRGRATGHDIPTVQKSGRLQLGVDTPQQETKITEKLYTVRSIRDKETHESQRDLISANEAPVALFSKKREASPNGGKRIAGQLIESPALAKVTCESEMLKIGEVAHSQPKYSNSAQCHGNETAAVTTSSATSMNRCVPLKEPISWR